MSSRFGPEMGPTTMSRTILCTPAAGGTQWRRGTECARRGCALQQQEELAYSMDPCHGGPKRIACRTVYVDAAVSRCWGLEKDTSRAVRMTA